MLLKKIVAWIAALMLLPPGAALADPPCVPEGGEVAVDFSNPDVGPDDAIDSAQGYEHDVFSDDEMGQAELGTGSGTTLKVGNKGGSLSGPNGQSMNGGTEGDCIEVYVEWKVRRTVTHTLTYMHFDLPGIHGTTETITWRTYEIYYIRSGVQDVCPC
ncbi:MAG: hypothetical protein HY812_06350 [Planctomycetes bacterium]|nr:hypothetical protein [Planctomycetota bacterium]